jgi:hypothetical protein
VASTPITRPRSIAPWTNPVGVGFLAVVTNRNAEAGVINVSDSGTSAGGVALLVVAGVGVWFGFVRESAWLAKEHATRQYGVPDSKIEFVGTRPHDCDFLTAPIGSKHCHYEREYIAEWLTLSKSGYPISYGNRQAQPPTACSSEALDFTHRCYVTELQPGEQPTADWRARNVLIQWRKVED